MATQRVSLSLSDSCHRTPLPLASTLPSAAPELRSPVPGGSQPPTGRSAQDWSRGLHALPATQTNSLLGRGRAPACLLQKLSGFPHPSFLVTCACACVHARASVHVHVCTGTRTEVVAASCRETTHGSVREAVRCRTAGRRAERSLNRCLSWKRAEESKPRTTGDGFSRTPHEARTSSWRPSATGSCSLSASACPAPTSRVRPRNLHLQPPAGRG